ncbi:hypothetical protein LOTGIDRAFT_153339 [Lottia gigantea]|uniref:Sushi domain-containing protein n=1 Tax=Lottia gigantea TaxID=225164 RepID=V4AFI5_LOTGI|nr:hypothetical protein LOTGIDRAFT_153339 [Lottia gigantea]ESO93865.1 hypothetical protein LOTGIDRAFT_153339 [Lottia gigantea]
MWYYKSALNGVLLFLQMNSAFTEVDCGDPPDILNAYREVNISTSNLSTTEGSVWYYQCFERFKNVSGDALRICKSTGFWEGNDIKCEVIKCPEPQYIDNSFMNKETNEYNTWVIYTCFPGYYKTLGNLERRCTAGAIWSGEQPYCAEIYCPFPKKPLRSTPQFTSLKWKGTLSYTCDYGTSLASGNLTRHCSDDATWDGEEPVCEEIRCGTPPEVSNATTNHEEPISNYGTIIYYSCDHGYLNSGGKIYSECGREGDWSEVDLDCVGVYCGKAPLFIGAKNNASGEMYMDIAVYECFIQLDDHIETWIKTCNQYGVWVGKEPECTDGWYDKKFEPEPVEAPGSVGIGITVFAIFVTLIICIIILDVATLKPHFVYLRRNLKDFRKTVRKQYRILKAHPKFIDFTYKIRMKKWDEKRLTQIRPESSPPSVLGEVTD